MGSSLFFELLGPVGARVDGREAPLGGPRTRAVLAALLLEPNRVVALESIVETAWGVDAPDTARFQSQNRVSGLRRVLRDAGGDDIIETVGAGYVVHLQPEQLDSQQFQEQARNARRAMVVGDLTLAGDMFRTALRSWRGPALYGLDDTPRLLAAAQRLNDMRLTAREELVDVNLARGRHHEVIEEILDIVTEHPWRERPAAQLMIALYRAGRRREALEAFDRTQHLLTAELGIDAGHNLVRLRDQILHDDPALAYVDRAVTADGVPLGPAAAEARLATPVDPAAAAAMDLMNGSNPQAPGVRTLPRLVPQFVGRDDELAMLDADARLDTDVAVCTISGPPGVGKTALAVHWAHRASARFPDGQLFVDLRGNGPGAPLRPIEALTSLLLGLGLPAEHIPGDETAAIGRYRCALTGKRVLVVLDNVAGADQVRPLLPPDPGCLALVTSRDRLTGLTAVDGARPIGLTSLSVTTAVELLRRVLGEDRVAADTAGLTDLAVACGRLPLALRIAAAQLREQPEVTLVDYVADLRKGGALEVLEIPGDESAAVRPALARSYERLGGQAARLFRLLGLIPGPDFSTDCAAALSGDEIGTAARVLERLVTSHLVERSEPDRFGLHDLLREFAVDRVAVEESGQARSAAVGRLFEYLVDRAEAATRQAFPATPLLQPTPTTSETAFRDRAAALFWLDIELPSLVAIALNARPTGHPTLAARLADSLRNYFWYRHDYTHWHETAEAGLAASTETGDLRGQAASAMSLGMSELSVSRYAEAIDYLRQAIQISRSLGWPEAEAAALNGAGIAYSELGDLSHAIESYRRAMVVNGELGRTTGRGNNLGNLGLLQLRIGQFRAAAEHLAEAVDIHRRSGGGANYAIFADGLGQAQRFLGRFDEAQLHFETALQAIREFEDIDGETQVLSNLSSLYHDLGRHDQACTYADMAFRLIPAVHDPDVRALGLVAKATMSASEEKYDRAATEIEDALSSASHDSTYVWLVTMTRAATISLDLGRVEIARAQAEAVAQRAAQVGFRDLEGGALTVLAEAYLADGDRPNALGCARRAADIHDETGHRLAEVRAVAIIGRAGGQDVEVTPNYLL